MTLLKIAAGMLAVMTFSTPAVIAGAEEAGGLTFQELQQKFPDGKYWNHPAGEPSNPDGWTETPCDHSISDPCDTCNTFIDYNTRWSGQQCFGFAMKVNYDMYGSTFTGWKQDNDIASLKAGDVVRVYNDSHSIIIQKVEGETVTFAECNTEAPCQISWNETISMAALKKNLTYVAHAPYEALQSPDDKERELGDVNGDGKIDIIDAIMINKAVLGKENLTKAQQKAADINGSGVPDSGDSLQLLKYIIGVIDTLQA
ncbi:MAG: dockerin type I repeat-containing protein [Oscillospiraceae bacterium]|nr:dockerin type I repeat-containing protein [Oscillospiraceae bacterium]